MQDNTEKQSDSLNPNSELPQEKVRDELAFYLWSRVAHDDVYLDERKAWETQVTIMSKQRFVEKADSIILKLQQAGWRPPDSKIIGTVDLADIEKNCERIEAEARQQAFQESKAVYEPYIKLLCDELNETVSFAASHGWKSTRYAEGVNCRKVIEDLINKPKE